MTGIYRPTKIVEARIRVESEHTKVARGTARDDDDALKKLIFHIVSLKQEEVISFARVLSGCQIHQISEYICLNYWKVKLNNLFEIISQLGDIEEWKTIYCSWQNRYDRIPDGDLIRKFLSAALSGNTAFHEYLKYSERDIKKLGWISAEDYIEILCSECIKRTNSYSDELIVHGVIKDTLLYNRCMVIFYQLCDRPDLLSYGASGLKALYLTRLKSDKEKLCINVYEKLTISDLQKMRELLIAFDRDFSDGDLQVLLSDKGYRLYQVWSNMQAVENAFTGYEDRNRREFWMKYIVGNKFRSYEDTLVIDFGKYVAVEFKGKAAGPAYIYDKKFFQETVEFHMNYMKKYEFQQWEYEKYQQNILGIKARLPHTDGWVWKFHITLRTYGIYQNNL